MKGLLIICATLLMAFSLVTVGAGCNSFVSVGSNDNGAKSLAAVDTKHAERQANQEESPLPPPRGHVNDYAHVLDAKTKGRLEETLTRLQKSSGVSFVVVMIDTTGSETIFDYSLAVARGWKIGGPTGEGLLLMVAIRDRQWHIQVTRQLETDLPDEEIGKLGQLMTDSFRHQHYGEGVTKCVDATIARLATLRGFKMDQ
ncbi:MAG TPA: TPM domain-containing protein [Pyrinomonadaceae bacterium]|jgi:uncharacterized protein|nr:TPM domain-containing protein [Pyrinomonadaceae bacterium]